MSWNLSSSEPLPESPFEQAQLLKMVLVGRATGSTPAEDDYFELRRRLMNDSLTKNLLPQWIRTCRTLSEFWNFIKPKFERYQERRDFLNREFEPLLTSLEACAESPVANGSAELLSIFDSEHVEIAWNKALARRDTDADGAITAAKALVETVCKHICSELGSPAGDSLDLPALYDRVSRLLKLAPSQYTEDEFKKILGGCSSVVNTMATLRNRMGDSHGASPTAYRPAPRHARLVVHMAGAMALFLTETFEARQSVVATN